MSGGYSKKEVVANIRKTRSLEELHGLAYAPKNQVHDYARKEAKAEIRRRLTKKSRVKKAVKNQMFKTPSLNDLMRM